MHIWLAMAIPVVCVLVLAFYFKKQIVWWELVIPLVVSVGLIALFKYTTQLSQTTDTEYWGGYVVQARYFEPWDEEVPCRHAKYRTESYTVTDADGKTHTETREVFDGYEHSYDVDYHPPYWQVEDSNGQEIGISRGNFERLVGQFGNRTFIDLNRDYHSQDGDEYASNWPGDDQSLESVTTTHRYTNKVQASDSVFRFAKVDPKTYQLFNYPKVQGDYDCPVILGYNGPDRLAAERKFQLLNAKLGRPKQVRIWILVFTDKEYPASQEQQAYWQGGNKNEFVCTIGIDKQKNIKWAYVFSWSEVESLKLEARNYILSQKQLDLGALADWLGPQVQQKFIRKEFKDFDYLTIEPPTWALVTTFLVTLLVNLGLSIWVVQNEFDEESQGLGRRRWRSYY